MTRELAQKLIKIGKILLIVIFAVFSIVIIVQSIQISSLKSKQTDKQNSLVVKQEQVEILNEQIKDIEDNYDAYCENKLRQDGYVKENESVYIAE